MLKNFLIFIVAAIGTYGLICLYMYFSQASMIHLPHLEYVGTPKDNGMDYEDIVIEPDETSRLHAWFIPNPDSRYLVWFFSGNAGNKSYMLDSIKIMHDLGFSIFIYDYRGFGRSAGKLNEQIMYQDAEAVWNYLTMERKIPPDEIILHGRSLGTAIASWVATHHEPAALIMESGFTSLSDMGKKYYKWLPIDYLLRWQYDNLSRISSITAPILFIHSRSDELTPYSHSERLFAETTSAKKFVEITGDHLSGFKDSGQIYTDGIVDFINSIESSNN